MVRGLELKKMSWYILLILIYISSLVAMGIIAFKYIGHEINEIDRWCEFVDEDVDRLQECSHELSCEEPGDRLIELHSKVSKFPRRGSC